MNEAGFVWGRNGQRHGGKDQADIDTGPVPLAVQCKDVARISIWQVAEDAAEQAANKSVDEWVISLKRRGRPTGDGLAIVPLWFFRRMAAAYYKDFLDGSPADPGA